MIFTIFTLYGFLMGAVIGSFLNVCIHRLPRGESLISPGSHCPHCSTPISWYHNIPILSYLVLRGRCSSCRKTITPRYLIVEILAASAGAVSIYSLGFSIDAFWLFSFTALLIVAVGTDVREKILPDEVTLGGTILGLLLAWGGGRVPLLFSLWGAVVGSMLFLAILLGYYALRGYHGMGFGDVKMMAFLGAFLGFPDVLMVILLGSLLGLVWGVGVMVLKGKSLKYALPFGAFLGAAALIVAYMAILAPGLLEYALPY